MSAFAYLAFKEKHHCHESDKCDQRSERQIPECCDRENDRETFRPFGLSPHCCGKNEPCNSENDKERTELKNINACQTNYRRPRPRLFRAYVFAIDDHVDAIDQHP